VNGTEWYAIVRIFGIFGIFGLNTGVFLRNDVRQHIPQNLLVWGFTEKDIPINRWYIYLQHNLSILMTFSIALFELYVYRGLL
jgi:hypothetical protein